MIWYNYYYHIKALFKGESQKMNKKRDNKNRVLEKGISQLPDGKYKYRYTDANGDRKEYCSYRLVDTDKTPKGKKNKASIASYKLQVAIAQKEGTDFHNKNITLNELFDICVNHKLDSGQIKAATFHNYNNAWKHTKRHKVSNSKVRTLRESDFQKLYSDLLSVGVGNGTVILIHKIHNVVMKFGCKEDYVRYNYAHEALKGFDVPLKIRKALTVEQQHKFVNFLRISDQYYYLHNVVSFMLETAIRVSEMAALTIHDVDLENGIVAINKQYLNQITNKDSHSGQQRMIPPKTPTSIREVPLSNEAMKILIKQVDYLEMWRLTDNFEVESYIEGEVCKNFLFLTQRNALWQSANFDDQLYKAILSYNKWEEIVAQEESREPVLLPKFSAHILRHTACTRLSEQGMSAPVLQRMMGHKNISTTMNIYNHTDQERLRREMKRIDELRQSVTV